MKVTQRITGFARRVFGMKASHADAYKAGLERAKQWTAETGAGYSEMIECFGNVENFIDENPPSAAVDHREAYRRGVLAGFGRPTSRRRR